MADSAQLNHRQRKFAELIVAGQTATAAYFASFPRCKSKRTAETEGSKLRKKPEISAFIADLSAEVREKSTSSLVMDMRERREFLARIKRTPIGRVDESSDLCQSYKIGKDGDREYKLPDKLRAIELDAKLAGELKDQPTPAGGVTIIVNTGVLPSLQDGYKRFQEGAYAGKN